MPRQPTRADDERDLEILRRQERGESAGTIAAALGLTRNTVIGVIARVRIADRGD